MDQKRFETITKSMGRQLTRRGALGSLVAGIAATSGVAAGLRSTSTTVVAGTKSNDQVCQGLDSGKIDLPDGFKTYDICASADGLCITGYCVKAGSKKQELGPEFVDLAPTDRCVTISHSSGKDISHFSFLEEPCTPEPETCVGTGTTHLGKPCTASSECCKGCCVAPFKPNNPNRAFVCANAVNATVGVCLPN